MNYNGQSISAHTQDMQPVTAAPAGAILPTSQTPGGTMMLPSVSSTIEPADVSLVVPACLGSLKLPMNGRRNVAATEPVKAALTKVFILDTALPSWSETAALPPAAVIPVGDGM